MDILDQHLAPDSRVPAWVYPYVDDLRAEIVRLRRAQSPIDNLDVWVGDVVEAWRSYWMGRDHRYGHDFPAFLGERLLTDFDLRAREREAHLPRERRYDE